MLMETFLLPTTAHHRLPGRRIAILAPHPDDEVFGCGGAIAGLVDAGIPVDVAILTDGQRWQDHGAHDSRREESRCAARVLGYGAPEFWGLDDGALLEVPDLAERIQAWVASVEADTLLAPSLWEAHRDHRACAQAAAQAVLAANRPIRLVLYEVGLPLAAANLLVDITPWQARKAQAMACFASQLERQAFFRHILALNRYRTYSLPRHVKAAEAFCLLKPSALPRILRDESAHTLHLWAAEKQLATATATLAEREATLAQTTALLAEREAALAQTTALLAEREAALARSEAERAAILASRSWRLTAPLRAAAAWWRGERAFTSLAVALARHLGHALPLAWRTPLKTGLYCLQQRLVRALNSPANPHIAQAQREACRQLWEAGGWEGRLAPPLPAEPPLLDLSLVTSNSARWLPGFFASLLAQDYPLARIHLLVVDNGSTDSTWAVLQAFAQDHGDRLAGVHLLQSANRGFGAGHNQAMAQGNAPWVLVVNPDVEFHPASLTTAMAYALADDPATAAWELRQMPYEHPKHYHPVTWETTWNSHACVLLRRAAVAAVGGYDERIFLYGEDVELSFRLRARGWTLRYLPPATITHHAYATPGEVKPSQYLGSRTANLFLRLRYGQRQDMVMALLGVAAALGRGGPFPKARRELSRYFARHLVPHLPGLVRERWRHRLPPIAPFRGMDYELARHGAFLPAKPLTGALPLVSVITRTMAGRAFFLWQAGMSALRQTYPHLEWIVVEDGGSSQREVVDQIARHTPHAVRYLPLPKVGRAEAGNRGLAEAQGAFFLFLDDDDLLYADHLETLVRALHDDPQAAAAYSLALEIPTTLRPDGSLHEEEPILHPGHLQPFDPEVLAHHNYIPIQALLFARRLWETRGGFDPSLEVLEDWNLWQRYAQGERFCYVPKVTSLYRTPADPAERLRRQARLDAAYLPVRDATRAALAHHAPQP